MTAGVCVDRWVKRHRSQARLAQIAIAVIALFATLLSAAPASALPTGLLLEDYPPNPAACTISGTDAGETIIGTPHADVICSGSGNDTVYGGGGDDVIWGGAGDDTIYGESDNDELHGGTGNDHLEGGPGNDTLFGGAGRDYLDGGSDNDTVDGDYGSNGPYLNPTDDSNADTIIGGSGTDTISGDAGPDIIDGGFDNDVIHGGTGDDQINGGSGTDTLFGDDGGDDIDGGFDNDTVDGGPGVNHLVGGGGNDHLVNQENDQPAQQSDSSLAVLGPLHVAAGMGPMIVITCPPAPEGQQSAAFVDYHSAAITTRTPLGRDGKLRLWFYTFPTDKIDTVRKYSVSCRQGSAGTPIDTWPVINSFHDVAVRVVAPPVQLVTTPKTSVFPGQNIVVSDGGGFGQRAWYPDVGTVTASWTDGRSGGYLGDIPIEIRPDGHWNAKTFQVPPTIPAGATISVMAHAESPSTAAMTALSTLRIDRTIATPGTVSANWAGYVSVSPGDIPVSAHVILPSVTCNTRGELSMWVGYDGWQEDSNTVEQDGISAVCTGPNASPTFHLWYELYKGKSLNPFPNVYEIPVTSDVKLKAGDSVDLFVAKVTPDRSHGIPLGRDNIVFRIAAHDSNGHSLMHPWSQTVTVPIAFSPKYNSAECIAETPSTSQGPMSLPNFGEIAFSNCSVVNQMNGVRDLRRIDIKRNGHRLAVTSNIDVAPAGRSFSVHWLASN